MKVNMPLNKEIKPNQTECWYNQRTHTHTHTHTHSYIYIYIYIYIYTYIYIYVYCRSKERIKIYFKIGRSTKRFVFFWFIYFDLSYLLHTYMFPACCFRQRTYIAQGLVNGVLNENELTLVCNIYIYIYIYIYITIVRLISYRW